MNIKKMYMCESCNRCYEYKLDANKCCKSQPIEIDVKLPDRYEKIKQEVVWEDGVSFYYKNSFNNLRDVPPHAKIYAEWEEPIYED